MVTETVTQNTELRKGISKKEALLLSSFAERKKYIITLSDILCETNCTYNHAKVIANRLLKKKWLIPIEKGRYLIAPLEAGKEPVYTEHEYAIASVLVQPYYISYWSALNYHGMTEQVPFTVFIATTKRRKNKKIHGVNYSFVTLVKNKFFGYRTMTIAGMQVNISDKEKTIVDCLDHPEYCGGICETAKALWTARQEIDLEKLLDYAIKTKNGAVLKRLGYLLQKLQIKMSAELDEIIRKNISKGYSVLDITLKKEGKHNHEWNLLVNVSDKKLLEWREVH